MNEVFVGKEFYNDGLGNINYILIVVTNRAIRSFIWYYVKKHTKHSVCYISVMC